MPNHRDTQVPISMGPKIWIPMDAGLTIPTTVRCGRQMCRRPGLLIAMVAGYGRIIMAGLGLQSITAVGISGLVTEGAGSRDRVRSTTSTGRRWWRFSDWAAALALDS